MKKTNNKIALIICYYGEFPWYFDYFTKTCSYNSSIDFIIITDNNLSSPLPDNIVIKAISMDEIMEIAQNKLGFKISLPNAYKLCDFKPAYGLLFSEYLKGYEFWGHGDLDVIYGDISSIVGDEILINHDFISVRPDYVCGFFSLYRNNEQMRNLFKKSKDYIKVFQNEQYYCFDECNFLHVALMQGKSILFLHNEIKCMTRIVKEGSLRNEIRAYFGHHVREGILGNLKWSQGKLTWKSETDIVLYHLIDFKHLPFKFIPSWKQIPDTFFINRTSFSKYPPNSTIGTLMIALFSIIFSVKKFVYIRVEYIRWLSQLYSAKRVEGSKSVDKIKGICGKYKNGWIEIDISFDEGECFATIGDNKIRLLMISSDRFIMSKFNVLGFVSTELMFAKNDLHFYNKLIVCPFYLKKLTLYKEF